MSKLTKIKEYISDKLKVHSPNSFDGFYNSGVEFYGRQEYEKAIAQFKFALEQKDIQPQVYYNLALSYQSVKDYDRAIVNYNKFLELKQDDYDGLYNIALAYFLKEDYPRAITFFEKSIEIKQEEDGVKSLVLAYLNNNEQQKAIDFAEKLLENSQNGADLYYSIAKVFENKNSMNKDSTYIDFAIQMYSKLMSFDSKCFDAYLSTSICYAKKGEWENSVDFCKKALDANPESYEANNQMGLVYYCCDEIKKAIEYYEKAIKLKPIGDYKVYSNLGYAYEKIAQYDKAVKIFNQLIAKFPKFPAKDEIKNHLRVLKTL